MKILVTGGAGFIGSNYVRSRLAERPHDTLTVLDKLTYAGRRENLEDLPDERVRFVEGDICDERLVRELTGGVDAVVNFAAETHVDRSISSPADFIATDILGPSILLGAARDAGARYVQISTDEVYGSIDQGSFTESSPLDPSSPYSAAKGGADLMVSAFHRTYGVDATIIRASNNYGPRQHPEKLIPLTILNAIHGDRVPLYGDGDQVRNWLFVRDFCSAIDVVLERGEAGSVYNAGGPDELENVEVVGTVLQLLGADPELIHRVDDRPGHDRRYSLASDRLRTLGWRPEVPFREGIARTVAWYEENADWWRPVRDDEYQDYYRHHYGMELGR